jgi:hypothetical protein
MSRNPYAPPKSEVGGPNVGSAASGVPLQVDQLYSPNQITAGAFLGSPLAAGWLAAHNFRVMRQPEEAGRALGMGIVVTLIAILIAAYLLDGFPIVVLPVAYCVMAYLLSERQFKSVITAHRAAGGTIRSSWRVVGIGLLCALILVTVFFLILPSLGLPG